MQDFQTFLAPAKINLFLHITGRRADGYHTLQSVFQLLDFYDTIQIKITTTGKINRLNNLENVPESQDLCVRAALALQLATGCKQGAEIKIEKRIPMGGGLGGGSSDAATVLLALNHLWQLHLDRTKLMKIGLTLGADIPVFIFGQAAWAEGIGEILSPINLTESQKNSYYVVLTPDEHVSTAQVFANLRLTRDTKPLRIADFSSSDNSSNFRNDLETIVCEDFPAVATLLDWLKPYGEARMSGSGASVFVAVNSKQIADKILVSKPANTRGFVAKGLASHPHYHFVTNSLIKEF